jgi:CHASE3 domain sensor protein
MKISDIEDSGQLASKDDLRVLSAELRQAIAELETRMIDRLIQSERAQRIWIWGLYALVIASFFIRHK